MQSYALLLDYASVCRFFNQFFCGKGFAGLVCIGRMGLCRLHEVAVWFRGRAEKEFSWVLRLTQKNSGRHSFERGVGRVLFARHGHNLTGVSSERATIAGSVWPTARVSGVTSNLKEARGKRLAPRTEV